MSPATTDSGSEIITLVLTPEQHRQLESLVRQQAKDRKGLLFLSVAPFIDSESQAFRMQARWLPWPIANKVLRLIRGGPQSQEAKRKKATVEAACL